MYSSDTKFMNAALTLHTMCIIHYGGGVISFKDAGDERIFLEMDELGAYYKLPFLSLSAPY